MKMLKVVCAALLCLSIAACDEPEQNKTPGNGSQGGNTPPLKPLPSTCNDNLLARFSWRLDNAAFGYVIEYGTAENVYTESQRTPNTLKSDYISLPRGSEYFVRVTKFNRFAEPQAYKYHFVIPTCADRAEFQKKNPNYVEPIDLVVNFTN